MGKSTVTAMLAQTLTHEESKLEGDGTAGKQVAVLDVDICGPSQPIMMGVEDEQVCVLMMRLYKFLVVEAS